MKKCLVCGAVLVLCCLVAVRCGDEGSSEKEEEKESKVMELTQDNWDQVINNTPLIMVEFYASWCEYCQVFEPKYEEAAEILSAHSPPIPLARVDGVAQQTLYNRMGVNGYPTIFVFHNGRYFMYEGRRNTESVVEFMKEEAQPDWKPPEDHVLWLTEKNFSRVVDGERLMLVEFYAPWCGHCKRLAPQYALAAKELDKDYKIKLAQVDATEETALAKKYGVDGYPTLFIFRNGKKYDYTGPRERKGIVEYMLNHSGPATKEFSSKKELDIFLVASLKPVVVAVLPDGEDSDFGENFVEVANLARSIPLHFWFTRDETIMSSLGLHSNDQLAIYQPPRFQSKMEGAVRIYHDLDAKDTMAEALMEMESLARPLVGHRSKATENWWTHPILVTYLPIDVTLDGVKDFVFWRQRLLRVKSAIETRVQVVLSDEVEYEEELAELGLKDRGDDAVVAFWQSAKEKYVMMDDFEEDNIIEFVELCLDGRVQPVLKSQKKVKQKGPVTVVVGSNFRDIVYDKTKDVLIEFYAPWCGHCKQLEPKYKQLAKKYSKVKNLTIAKFDATANDAPAEFEVKGFPTIFFVAAGELNQVVKYEGGREVDDFSSFLEENAIHSLGKQPKQEL